MNDDDITDENTNRSRCYICLYIDKYTYMYVYVCVYLYVYMP
jgi:hypothetical protein